MTEPTPESLKSELALLQKQVESLETGELAAEVAKLQDHVLRINERVKHVSSQLDDSSAEGAGGSDGGVKIFKAGRAKISKDEMSSEVSRRRCRLSWLSTSG